MECRKEELKKELEACKRIRKRTGFKGRCRDCAKIRKKLKIELEKEKKD